MQLNGCSFWTGRNYCCIWYTDFARAVCHVYTCIKKGTFNHSGRSKAWNSTHHRRYVFPKLEKCCVSLCLFFLCVCLRVLCVLVVVIVVLCLCVSVFLVVFGASATKLNALTCAPATASDLESAWRSLSIRTRTMVNRAVEGQSQGKLWWGSDTDAQNVCYTWVFLG